MQLAFVEQQAIAAEPHAPKPFAVISQKVANVDQLVCNATAHAVQKESRCY